MGTTTSQREGTVTSTAGGHIIRFERWLQHPATRVWEAISRPENLARWLAEVSGPIHEQGSFTLHFAISDCGANCRVTKFRPPDLLEYTWDSHDTPQSMVRWEIFPEGRSACRLVLTHTVVQLDLKPPVPGMYCSIIFPLPSTGSKPPSPGRKQAGRKYIMTMSANTRPDQSFQP